MADKEKEREREEINPAARRDRPGEPHEDLARSGEPREPERPHGYQEAEMDPLDNSGIAE